MVPSSDIEYELLSSFEEIRVKVAPPPELPTAAEPPLSTNQNARNSSVTTATEIKPQLPPRVPRKPLQAHEVSLPTLFTAYPTNSYQLLTM